VGWIGPGCNRGMTAALLRLFVFSCGVCAVAGDLGCKQPCCVCCFVVVCGADGRCLFSRAGKGRAPCVLAWTAYLGLRVMQAAGPREMAQSVWAVALPAMWLAGWVSLWLCCGVWWLFAQCALPLHLAALAPRALPTPTTPMPPCAHPPARPPARMRSRVRLSMLLGWGVVGVYPYTVSFSVGAKRGLPQGASLPYSRSSYKARSGLMAASWGAERGSGSHTTTCASPLLHSVVPAEKPC
jgi:hypothetical protein